ncbi:glycosyltransferase [Nocardioides sp.]|uniref:glycosyltransferase n=1 Tax=Nocardioides sp. TaxID=35761 RepID=UPI0035198691
MTAFVPHPAAGGPRMRAWDWARELAEDHEVVVGIVGDDPTDRRPIEAIADVVELPTRQARPGVRRLARLLPVLAWWRPEYTAAWHLPDPDLRLADVPASRVVTFRSHVHEVARHLGTSDSVRELDLDDRESTTLRSVAGSLWRLGRYREALVCGLTALQYVGVERRLRGHYDRLHLASATDRPRLRPRRGGARPVDVRPNRIGPLTPRPARAVPATPTILFVGTLDYPPNEEAVRWLVGPMRAALHRAGLRGRLVIAGLAPPAALRRRLEVLPDVRLVADAPELAPLYREADVVIIPLRAGGGTKIKTVEALGHGVPVLGSPEAFRGLPATVAEHCGLVRSTTDAVTALRRLQAQDVGDLERRARIARAALQPAWLRPPGRRRARGTT